MTDPEPSVEAMEDILRIAGYEVVYDDKTTTEFKWDLFDKHGCVAYAEAPRENAVRTFFEDYRIRITGGDYARREHERCGAAIRR